MGTPNRRNVRIDDDTAAELRDRTDAHNMNEALREVLGLTPRAQNWKAGLYSVDAEVFAILDAAARETRSSIRAVVRARLGLPAVRTYQNPRRRPAAQVA